MMTDQNYSWHYSRLGKFTASEIYKLMECGKGGEMFGKGAMTYIRQKAAELLTMEVKEEVSSYSINWGYHYEKEASMAFERESGLSGIYYGKENPKFFEWGENAGGSPDWEYIDGAVRIGADFKCPYNSDIHIQNLLLKSPSDLYDHNKSYYIQCQSNMMFRDWGLFYYVSYDSRFREDRIKKKILEIPPDRAIQCMIKHRIEAAVIERDKIIDQLLNA